ncbi:MAG TPA: helix-turn-helix domain-containing protein [Baekduia sp.]|nr:helix-turn-helix domain-containing protein [Baekduia sp.]
MRNDGDHGPERLALDEAHIEQLHRGRVADAVVEVLSERGYPAVTVADIAARATMSSRTFYRLYDNKAAAFAEVHHRLRKRAHRRMRAAMACHEEPRDQVCAALQAVLACVDEHPAWGRAFVADGPASDGSAEPLYLATIQGWLDEAADLLPEPRDMTRAEQGAAVCGILRARLATGGRPASDLLPALSRLVVGERLDALPATADRAAPPAPELTWDALVQALLDHDAAKLAALQQEAEAALDGRRRGDAARTAPRDEAELAGLAHAAAVGRVGGVAGVLALAGHGTGDGLPSRQALRCLRYVAAHPGTSGRGVLHGLGFRNESQVSRLLSGLAGRGLVNGSHARGGPRAWTATAAGEQLLRSLALPGATEDPAPELDPA